MRQDPTDQTESLPGEEEPEKASMPSSTPSSGARPAAAPAFVEGELVAGRYRIVRHLARGGMGEVYEAEDTELHEPLALKTIRPEVADVPEMLERFRQEIYLARKVTHPNVCRIFDVFHHHRSDPEAGLGRVTFLTMELLRGETLSERLRRAGPMPASEAVPLLLQMCEGLEAAHRAGVIHCDLKSSNVVLVAQEMDGTRRSERGTRSADETPTPSTTGRLRSKSGSGSNPSRPGVRVVLTDFGLAHGGAGGASVAPSSGKGRSLAGSPAYIAPEQVTGGPVSPATDLYSLGVVMYEMATGQKPFLGETALRTARMRLKGPPEPPRRRRPEVDPAWEAVILRCLQVDPASRFASAREVAEALSRSEAGLPAPGRRRLAALGAAALLAVALGLGLYGAGLWRSGRSPEPQPGGRPSRPAVAVLGFKNVSGQRELAWLSTALSEMLSTELAAGEKLRTIPGENISRMKLELELSDTDALARDTLAQIRGHVAADFVVLGSYLAVGEAGARRLRLDLRLQDARPSGSLGETLLSVAETGSERELFQMVSRVGARLRRRLEVGELSSEQAAGVLAARPSSGLALQLYSEGLQKLRLFDALGARDLLERAVAADPGYPLAHAALAEAWQRLGYDLRAQEAAKQAFDLSAKLSREEKLLVEAVWRRSRREWDRVVQINGVLWGFFPDNLEYGLMLAEAQAAAGRAAASLATLEQLRGLPRPVGDDPRIDLAEARAAHARAEYGRQLEAAGRAVRKGQELGARLLVAQARLLETTGLTRLGRTAEALAASQEAERIFAAAGDRWDAVRALTLIGNLLADQGDLDGARGAYERWLALCREVGNKEGEAGALNNLANLLAERGDLAGAKAMFEQSLGMKREVGDKAGIVRGLNNTARMCCRQGELARARQLYLESLALCQETGNRNSLAATLLGLGRIRWLEADLGGAVQLYDAARSMSQAIGNRSLTAEILAGLAEVRMMQGDLAGARRLNSKALAVREELGEGGHVAESRLALAIGALLEGRAAEAEVLARQAVEQFQRERQQDQVLLAQGLVARVLLAEGKVAEAVAEMERLGALAQHSQDLSVRLTVSTALGRVQAVLPGAGPEAAEAAVRSLDRLAAEAEAAGFVGHAMAARLASGEVEAAAGRVEPGRTRLEALEREARARGWLFLAERAAKARAVSDER